MAYIYNQDREDQKNKQQAQEPQLSQNGAAGGAPISAAPGSPPTPSGTSASGTSPQNKATSSGRFTNIQNYLTANKNSNLGTKLEEGLQNKTNQVVERVGQEKQNFEKQTNEAYNPFVGGEDFVNQTIQNAPTAVDDNDQFNRFQTIRTADYKGPQDLQNYSNVKQDVQNVRSLAGLGNTESGRFSLLKNFFGSGNQYSRGAQTLDNLVLQGQGNNLQQLKRISNQGLQNLEQTRGDAQGEYAQKLKDAQDLGQKTTQQLSTASGANEQQIQQRVAEAQVFENKQKQAVQDINDLLSGRGLTEVSSGSNVLRAGESASGDKVTDINKALKIATEAGIIKAGDNQGITDLYTRLNTPVFKTIEQYVKNGQGDLLGYNNSSDRNVTNNTIAQSKLDFGAMLRDALRNNDFSNLTAEGLATADQKSRSNALSKLGGQLGTYNPDAAGYQSSTHAFDLASLQGRIDKELADLGGVERLPDVYNEVPLEEKLRYTFAPTGAELGQDMQQDFNALTDSNASASDKALALARLTVASPIRTATSIPINTATNALDQAQNNTAQFATLGPLGLGMNQINNAAGFVQNAPGLQEASNPLYAAINPLTLPAFGATELSGAVQTANNVLQEVLNPISSIGNIFCYVAGTPIRMDNGSYKAVDKLKMGDKLYLGGKVTGTGEVLEKVIYEYKGTKVSGNHAVFENGKFIRVKDSPLAKKVSNKPTKVYPIVSEKHLVVTKTHIGTDFAEIEEGHNVPMDERLEKLNNDRKLIGFLNLKEKMVFNGNSKVRK